MGSIESPIEALERLEFRPFPSKPTSGLTVVRVAHRELLLGKDAKGNLYCHTFNGPTAKSFYTLSDWRWTAGLMHALVRLGVVEQQQADEHMRAAADAEEQGDARSALRSAEQDFARFGVKLTKRQINQLRKKGGLNPL